MPPKGIKRLPLRPLGRVPLFGLTSRLSELCLLDLKPNDLKPEGLGKARPPQGDRLVLG